MLTLRLARAGTKKRPVYHLVAADSRSRRDGRFVENLGYYIPGKEVLVLEQDRIAYWLSVGAKPSPTAKSLIKKAKDKGNQPAQAKPKYEAPPVEAPPPKKEEPAEAKKDEAKADDAKADEAKADDAKPAEAKADEAKADEAKPEAKAEEKKD